MKIQITALFSGAVLFEHEAENNTLRIALDAAIKARADLSRADLSGANLSRANLSGEILNKAPISVLSLKWAVLITGQYMCIGCRRHTHEEWRTFTDSEIKLMDSSALAFWEQWKTPLLTMCEANHEATVPDQQPEEVGK